MPSTIESITTAALSAALDAARRRQALVAENIANAGTEGYQPLRLPFEAHLDDARAVLQEQGRLDLRAVDALRGMGSVVPQPVEGSGGVRIDEQMVDLARHAVEFQALVQGISRHLSLLALAAADGKK